MYKIIIIIGWIDDGVFMQKDANSGRRSLLWNNFGSHHAFTTGRAHHQQRGADSNSANKIRPKGPSQTLKVS